MHVLARLVVLGLVSCGTTAKVAKLVVTGESKTLRERPPTARASSPASPQILFLAFDGVSRGPLYKLLRAGKLPNLSALLGGDRLAHAYLDDSFLSNLPSTTMPAWVSVMTGKGAAESGVTGNEYFIRERREFACPAPVSFKDAEPTLAIFTDDYLNKLIGVPTVYEAMHVDDPEVLIWVVMNHVFRGADRLLLAKKTVLASAVEGFVEAQLANLKDATSRAVYEKLDLAAIDALVTHLQDAKAAPDVLTLYLSGTDLYAHIAKEGPDDARDTYLVEVVDPALAPILTELRRRSALEDRWVIVSADHGHTEIVEDQANAIGTSEQSAPGVLAKTGFRVRPFRKEVEKTDPFSAVLAYGGAMAYVYLADRSKCPGAQDVCAWSEPPRYREDVLAAAEAFHKNNKDGSLGANMKGALDMIFVREPKPVVEVDNPFEVYVGDGKTMAIDAYLAEHPHPTYVALADRMRGLAVGVHGERAGDILLLAHNGDRKDPKDRFYFSEPYRSWHGSPSKLDSEIPLIVAHRARSSSAIKAFIQPILGDRPYQQKIFDIMLALRRKPPR